MSNLQFVNIDELKKLAEKSHLSMKITEYLIITIRHLHFVKGFDNKKIFSQLNLPNNDSMNLIFLKMLGYTNWDSYQENLDRIKESIEEKQQLNGKSTVSNPNIIKENKEKIQGSKNKICILNLKNNKYYVGETDNVHKFVNKIKNGNGPRWTQIHKFKSINQILEDANLIQETLNAMKKFGWTNVRGYAWSQVNMKKPPLELRKTMGKDEMINQEKFNETVYVLKLEHNKWFLGKCLDEYLEKRINRYKYFSGNPWIKEHKVIEVERLFKNGDLKALTLEYMKKYGWQNVRGHHWLNKSIKNPPKELSYNNLKANKTDEFEQINIKERLLGIIKTKKKVKIDYIEKYLKIPKKEIASLIFDFVGNGIIIGEFNEDDTEFVLNENNKK